MSNKLEKQIETYRHAVEINPNSFEAHHDLGKILQNQGQLQEAIESYKKAIWINPNFARSHNNLGQCLVKQKKFEEAIAAYRRAIEIEPKASEYYHNFGDVQFQRRDWGKAVNLYQRAIEINPNFAWSHYNLGRALAEQGKTEEAIVAYEKAIELKPNFAQCYCSLGNAWSQLKRPDKAAECYRHQSSIYSKVTSSKKGVKPNFFIIGAMKSGTTSLHDILSKHPDILMSKTKEPEFFCTDHIYARGLAWYESLFPNAEGKIAIGESSTSYTKRGCGYSDQTVQRIAQEIPNAKLIYIVRNPLERIESHWRQGRYLGWCSSEFREAVKDQKVINPSRYWWQISAYRDYFSDDRIQVLFFEDFKENPHQIVTQCLKFLGVEPLVDDSDVMRDVMRPRNISDNWQKPEWYGESKRRVIEQIAEDSLMFLKFYGKPSDFWNIKF